ncbi:MAG: hypothetical protein MI784_00465 [Cytophagales bacterium]|nr:hypothetical protein [Cytophagales bacterium]
MHKAKPHFTLKDRDYIQLSRLPLSQIRGIRNSLPPDSIASLQIHEFLHSGFVEYDEYDIWFDDFYERDDMEDFGI